MKHKIKSIEIDSFRIYSDKQIFSFENEFNKNKTANLVVIFGPNGFGKTSFIDAIEWALTGSIQRLKSVAKKEKGKILANNSSEDPHKIGTVKIIMDSNEVIEVHTKKLIGGRQTDWAEGNIINAPSEFNIKYDKKENIYNKYILDHSKIDDFLKSTNSSEKYKALSLFWDDINNSGVYLKLNDLYQRGKKEEGIIIDKEKEIKEIITKISVNQDKVKNINVLVQSINDYNLEGIELDNLSVDKLSIFVDELVKLRLKVDRKKDELSKKVKIRKEISDKWTDYLKNIDDKVSVQNSINDLNADKENLNLVNVYTEKIKKVSIKQIEINKKHEVYKDILIKIPKFMTLYNDNMNLEKEKQIIVKSKKELDFNYIDKDQEKKEILSTISRIGKEEIEIRNKLINIPAAYSELVYNKDKIIHVNKRISSVKQIHEYRNKKCRELLDSSNYIREALTYLNNSSYQSFFELMKNQSLLSLQVELDIFTEKISDIKKLTQKYQEIENEIINNSKVNNLVNKLILDSKSIVEKNKLTNCPVCNKEYTDYRILLEEIDNHFVDVKDSGLTQYLNDVKRKITINEQEVVDIVKKIEQMLIYEKKKIDEKFSFENRLKLNNMKRLKDYENASEILKEKYEQSKLYFINLNFDFELINSVSVSETISEYKVSLESLKNERIDLNRNLANIKQSLKSLENRIESDKNHIEILDKKIKNFNNNSEVTEFKKNLELINEKYDENLNHRIDNSIKEINKMKIEMKLLKWWFKRKIILIKNQIMSEDSIAVEKELENLNIEKKEIEYFISDMNKKIMAIKPHEKDFYLADSQLNLFEEENLLKEFESVETAILQIEAYNELIAQSDSNLKDTLLLDEVVHKKNKIEEAVNLLNDTKTEVFEFIQKEFEKELNYESINTIYQMIDPHPDFNKIRLATNLNLLGKPELKIYVTDDKGDELIAPSVFFSSAQLNILSLSIFLARALKSGTNEVLQSIIMDDPIQHFDDMNTLSFIDLIRIIVTDLDKQVIISTHNENFFNLLRRKLHPSFVNSKFIKLESFGKKSE